VRIERRKIESAGELTKLVTEVLEGVITGIKVVDHVDLRDREIEAGILAGDSDGRLYVVMAKEKSGDSLVLSYGRHLEWLKVNKERMAKSNPELDWSGDPGIVMLADDFSPYALTLTSMLAVEPALCFTMKCLGIGDQKGLYIEPVDLPKRERVPKRAPEVVPEPDAAGLLTRAVGSMAGIADDLSVSASFGYVSESLDWVPVANLRSRRGTLWIESGPGKWTTKRIEDETSLGEALNKVKESYQEVVKNKGGAKNLGDDELSEAERKSLRWE
jgi:hypothetical protein